MSRKFSISRKMSSIGLNFSENQPNDSSSPIPWPIVREDYKILRPIGQGATSNVYEAECVINKRSCAMKTINLEKCNNSALLEEIKREIKSMKNMKNENIVTYYASFLKGSDLFIIMDICQKGSLLDIIKCTQTKQDITSGVFNESAIATILKDVLKGLIYIHDSGLVHRDLKCGNLLVNNNGIIQIADFGVAAFLAAQPMQDAGASFDNKRFTFVGTPCWMAPEVMQQLHGYNQRADIWSLGITTIELATGQAPYAKYTPMKVLMLTLQNDSPDIDTSASTSHQYSHYGQKYRRFTKSCLNKKPELRPSAKDLIQSPFIKSKVKDREWLCKLLSNDLNANSNPLDEEDKIQHTTSSGEWNFETSDTNNESVSKDNTDSEKATAKQNSHNDANHVCKSYRITLRKRNPLKKNELEDISFDYTSGKDSFELLTRELVEADLLDGCDMFLVAHNMSELVANQSITERVFALNSVPLNGVVVENELQGFAKVLLRCINKSDSSSALTSSANNSDTPRNPQESPNENAAAPTD